MSFLPSKPVALLVLALLPVLLPAQVETSGREDERMDALARSAGEWKAPKSKISIGFRLLNSGGKVNFTNLGEVPSYRTIAPASDGAVVREYSNGTVRLDGPRGVELNDDGTQKSTPGGRFPIYTTSTVNVTDADGNVTGTEEVTTLTTELLSYTPGLTREWSGASADQLSTPGYVSFSVYNTTSDGGSASHKQGPTGGVEFQISRDIGQGSRHLQWGMAAGITLNDINGKAAGSVNSTLHTYTDYYSLNGQVISEANLNNPSFTPFLDGDGQPISGTNMETTVAINAVPDGSLTKNDVATVGGASVAGNWQVKGTYFMLRLGPSVRTQITDRLGLTASLGFAGGYAGTRYSAHESYTVPELPDVILDTNEVSTATKFLSGYYADVNLEWTANETLGLFTGFTAQQLSAYDQKLGDRVAKIDLGSSVGLRGGVSIKF